MSACVAKSATYGAMDRVRPTRVSDLTCARQIRTSGFTLIEIIAVVAIISMVFALGIPQLGRQGWDALGDEAESLAESLRFARQRAIMTGVPHRLLVDLEEGAYRIEWYVSEERAMEAVSGSGGGGGALNLSGLFGAGDGPGSPDGGGDGPLDLYPPEKEAFDYHPIPNRQLGSFRWLDDALYFVGVEGTSGWVESGDYSFVFYEDGTTASTRLELADADDNHITLEIEPVLERVRVRTGGARS